jgi:Domain of unknown function (DUF2804), C-terminal/Domain of unknown function (DUF2804), N-terminal
MTKLIGENGRIDFGVYDNKITDINYMDYNLETPMGRKILNPFKKFRFNMFNFVGIMGPELMAGFAMVDFKGLSNGFFYVYERKTNRLFETKYIAPGFKVSIGSNPAEINSSFKIFKLGIKIAGNRISAKGKNISLEATLDTESTAPLRLCTRAGYRGWVYTEKTSPVRINGEIEYDGNKINIASPDYMALIDWSAGFMRRNTYWNWAAIAGTLSDGRSIGLNLASGVNETGFCENCFWINGKMTNVGTINFQFDSDSLMSKWKIDSSDRKIALVFTPENSRNEKTNAILVKSRFTQLMGTFDGTIITDSQEVIKISALPGWTEDHYAKW